MTEMSVRDLIAQGFHSQTQDINAPNDNKSLPPNRPSTPKILSVRDLIQEGFQSSKEEKPFIAPRGPIDETVSALGAGFAQTGQAIGGTMEMLGVPGGQKIREEWQAIGELPSLQRPTYLQQDDKIRGGDWRWWVRNVGENIPNFAMMYGVGGAAGTVAKIAGAGIKAISRAALAGGFGGSFTMEAGSQYAQAKSEMLEEGYTDPDEIERVATMEGLVAGTVNAIIEMIPMENVFGRTPVAQHILKRILKQGILEGSTESIQEGVNIFAEKIGHKPDQQWSDQVNRILTSGIVGGVLGGGIAGPMGATAHKQQVKQYNALADQYDLKDNIYQWKDAGISDQEIATRVTDRLQKIQEANTQFNQSLQDQAADKKADPLPQVPEIDSREMVDYVLYAEGKYTPPAAPVSQVAKSAKEKVLSAFGMKSSAAKPQSAPVEPEAGMTVNSVETTDLGQAQQNQMRQAEDQKKAARAQGEGLFDKVLTDLTAEGQQQIEAARLAEDQAREEEQARLAEAEAQKVAAAVAAADQQQAQVKSALAADDSRKQAIVDEVMGLSDKRLFTAAQAEAGWNIVPDGRGSYALETPQGNVPVNLMQIREQLAARRIADYDAKMAKQQADEEATQRMEAEAAERRARKLEKKRIEYLRKSLQGMSLTQGQVDSLEQMRDQLTPDEIRRLDLHKRDLAQKEAAKAFEAKAPAAPIQPEAVLEEKPNPEKATTEQDAAAQETALIDAMLIELDGAARGGLLLEDETTGEKTRTGTGIGWLSAANQKGWGIGTADARTILEKAREGKPLTERQQNIYNDLTRQAQQSAPGDLAEELLWVGKGFQPLRAGKVSVDEMTAGDAFVIGGEEYKVSDIDEDGNVTLKDGTIKKVKAGTELSGVDYVKIDQEAVSFDPDQLTDEEQQPAALAPKSGTMEDKGPAEIVESAATSQAEKTGETAKNPVTQGARSLGARPEVEIESKRQARIDYDRSESKRNIKLLIKKIKELPYKKRASVVAGDYYDSVKNFVNDLRKEGGVDEDTISVLVNSGLYDDAYLKEIIPEHQPPAKQQGAKSLGVRPAAAPAETSGRQMYRGSGRENEAAVYNDLTDQKALLGDGQFWALSEKDAKTYGPNVESKPIPEFSKPLIVKDDYAWQSLIKKAVGKYDSADERISYPNPFGLPKEQMDLWRKGVSDYLRENGHDALIINMDGARGDDAKTLYNAFGHSQIFIPAAQAAQAPAQLSKPPEDSISGKVEAAGASPEVTVPQGARSLGAKPALQSAAPAETSKEGVFTNHGNPYNLAFEPGKSYDITYRSDGGQVRKFKGYIFKEDEDYGKAQNWKFTHPTKGNLESFSKSSIIAAGENQQSTQGAKSLGARPKGAKTHAWEIKKQFEEDNRKTFESLSYVGDLIKREELQGDWIRLTYADKPTRNAVTVDVIESMGSAANRFENGDVVSYKNKLWSVAGRHVNRITIQEQGNKDQMLIVDPRHLTLLPKASLKPAPAEAAVPAAEQVKGEDLSTKSTSELVGDIFSIINDHIGKRGSVPVVSGKEIVVDDSLYQKLKPYLAEIVNRAKTKALDAKAYLYGAVDSMPEGKAKTVYEASADRYLGEDAAAPAEKKPAEKTKLTYEQFAKQYQDAFANTMKYTTDQVGSRVYSDQMAELADEYPEFLERFETAEEAKAAPKSPDQEEIRQRGVAYDAGLSGKRFPIEYEQTPILRAAYDAGLSGKMFPGTEEEREIRRQLVTEAPAKKTSANLSAYGLTVTKGTTNTGKTVWNISGKETRTWKDTIKKAGGRWYGPKKVWSFYNGDPTSALLVALPPIEQIHPNVRHDAQPPPAPTSRGQKELDSDLRRNDEQTIKLTDDEIIDQYLEGKQTAADRGLPQMMILTGGPAASGKSTGKPKTAMEHMVVVNSDRIGELLGAGIKTPGLHERSSEIAKKLLDRALADGYDIMYDSQLTNFELADNAITDVLKNGGSALVAFSNIDAETSIVRTGVRYQAYKEGLPGSENRYVPEEASIKGYNRALPTFLALFNKYKGNPNVDFKLTDNNVDFRPLVNVFDQTAGKLTIDDQELFDNLTNIDYIKIEAKDGVRYERKERTLQADLGREAIQARRDALLVRKRASQSGSPVATSRLETAGEKQKVKGADHGIHDESATKTKDDRAGTEGSGAADVSGIETSQGATAVPGGTRRVDDGRVRSDLHGTDAQSVTGSSERLPAPSSGLNIRTEPGVGRSNGDMARIQRSGTDAGRDHVITPGAINRSGSWIHTASQNLDIIELAKKLTQENRQATPEEQELLARYTGFGASDIANHMFPGWAEEGKIQMWRVDSKWKPLVERMTKLLTPAEIAAAARSTQYAHYTSAPIISSIYRAMEKFGFTGGRVLEPGMGVGSFFGLMPEVMRAASKYTGIEMDAITAQIAKHLYPNQNLIEGDYTKQRFPNGFFDLGVGNPPFSSIKILSDPDYKKLRLSLHDFFFVKTMDKIRPGGLMVFITSRYTMDKQDDRVRKMLNQQADLLGAIRLPQTAFKHNAGTEVVTDVLFLRKKVPGEQSQGQLWDNVSPVNTPEGEFLVNEYFVAHPEMVLGQHSGKGKMYGPGAQYTVLPSEGDIEAAFDAAVTQLPSNVYSMVHAAPAAHEAAAIEKDFNPLNKKEGGLYLSEKGVVMVTESGAGVPVTSMAPRLTPKDLRWLSSYIDLRNAVKQCQYDQLHERDWEKSLQELNRVYATFKLGFGRILDFTLNERKDTDEDGNKITVAIRKLKNIHLLKLDVEYPLVSSLEQITEDGKIVNGPFLEGRTIKKPVAPEIKSAPDALAVSLNERGKLDLAHIASLLGQSDADVIEQLGDLIYETPDKGFVTADEYLSGDVVTKLADARAAAKLDPKYNRNVDALAKSQPTPLSSKDVTVSPGSSWVPVKYYNSFIHTVLELPTSARVNHSTADNQWSIEGLPKQSQRGLASEWSTPDRGANEIFMAVLNNATIRVYRTQRINGQDVTSIDPQATAQVNDVAKRLRARFKTWVWEDANRAREILDIYNATRNNIVPRRFDGRHLTLPGVSLRYTLLQHQKEAIWRIIQDGNTYIAHAVGAGKTYEMVAAGMEMKRLGLISKPLYVVPNHMLQQFSNEFQDLYPMAHIMVADDENFHTSNRRRFMAQAALNNPDAIVITHSAFGLLKMKEENIVPVRDEIIDELRLSLDDLKDDKHANRIRIKQMEKRIEQTEQRFAAMIAQGDNVLTFEDMGVDFLFVDEAHQFRKLDFTTNRQAKGIDPIGSVRAMGLYIKTKWLGSQRPGRSHVFASGTPITNTMGELYTIMKYFSQEQMARDGIDFFDSWATEYGEMASVPEMNAAGRYEIVDRFAKFVNVPELMSRARMFMDVLTSSQLGGFVQRPKIQGGQPTIVVTPASAALKTYQDEVLQPRIETSRHWKPSPQQPGNPDPLINIITDGRLASIDIRFVQPNAPNDPGSKLNQYIDTIIRLHQETKDNVYLDPATGKESPVKGAAQVCFFNHGFGRQIAANRGFDARAWAMSRFKEAGIPTSEIAWIEDYDTAAKKEAVMKELRTGTKRILLGSAKKMGTGMNVQTRLANMTYLDPPWYPSDVEQPLGRIIRQGNQNKEVGVYYFSTRGSYDATMWQMVTRKAKFIEDALAGGTMRSMEDISEASLYEMAAALASGDERAIRLAGLNADINNLDNLRSAHFAGQRSLAQEKDQLERLLPGQTSRVEYLTDAAEKSPAHIRYAPLEAKIGARAFNDKKDFGPALRDRIVALRTEGKEGRTSIGTFFGMDLVVAQAQQGDTLVHHGGFTQSVAGKLINQLQLRMTDKITYEVATDITETSDVPGLVTRLLNRAQSVHSDLAEAEQQLENMNKELKKINSRMGAPFELEQELHEKTAESAQLNRELEAESRATANHGIRQTDKEPWELTIKEIKDMVLGEHGDSNEWGKISTILIGGMPLRPEYESIIRKAQLEGKQIPKKVFDENPHLAPTPGTPMPAITEDSAEKTKRLDAAGIKQMVTELSGLLKGTSVREKNGRIFLKTKSGNEVRIDSVESIDQNLIQVNAHYDPATAAGKRIRGFFAEEDGTFSITLSRSAANAWTLSHEFYHFLEAIGAISNADKLILNRKISALMAKNADEYKHLTGRSAPEQRAEYIGRALMGMYDAKSPSGKILARIREVIDQIVNALGVRTARGVIRDIEAGKIYEGQAIGNGLEAIGGKDNKYSITNHWWEGRDWQKEIDNLPLTYIQGPRPNIEKQGYIPITRAEADYFEKNGIDGITAFVELKGMETTGEEGWFIKPPVKWAEARRYKDGKIVKRFPADVEVFYYAAKKRYQDSLVSRNAGKSGTQQAGRRGATLRQFSIAEDDTTSSTQTQKTPLTLGQKAENVFAKRVAEPLGRKAAQGAASLGARVSGDTRATIQKLAKHFNEFWKPFSTVPDGDKILAKRYQAMGNVARAVRFIEDMNQKMSAWPDEVKRDVFWYLNGDIPIESIPEEARDLAKMIQRRTEVIGEMLVDRGILAEGQFAKYQGKYVHYLYAKHVLGDDAPIFLTSTGKLNLTYTKSRNTNMTLQQRKELGLIEDASVAVPVGMGKALTDIAKFDYLESIADNPDWVWQPSMINVPMGSPLKTPIKGRTRRFVKMGIGKLVEEVKIYDKMAAAHPSPEVSEIRDILRDALTKAEQASENMPDDFVQLPTSKGYGALAGAYVRKPIADDLMPVLDVATDRGKLMNTLLSIERQGMAGFKMGKVALNFPTAFRNVISNIIQNNMRGRPLSKIPGDIIRACESLKAKDQYYEEAFGMGLFHTNWFVSEINDVLEAFRGIVPQKGWKELGRDVVANATLTKPVTFDRIVTALTKLAKYYGKIDDINKLAIFIEQREAGKSADEAALTAMKWGMDYSLTSRSIKGLRQTIVPFATYQYKIAPLIAESLKTRPWVLAKFALLYPAAKMLAMALHDLDDDDWDDLEKQLPAYIKKSGSMLILPWKSDKDQWQWVNLEYFFPWGNALAIFRDARQMDSGEALRDLGISNPFLSMFYSGLSAREDQPPLHAYFGTPIYNDLDPGWMKAAKYLEYMANTWAPSMLTRQGAIGYTGKAIMGDEDRWGRSVSLPQAAGRWFGLNIVSVSPEQSRAQVSVKIQELHKELSRIEANPSYSEEEKEAYRSRMNERLADLAEESPSSVLPILKAKGQDPVYDALKEMAKQGILHTAPPSRSVEIGGIPYKMTMDQYRVYLQKSSDIARPKLQALVLSPGWATMSGKRKAQAVSAIVSHARKGVRQRIKAEIARERRSQAQSQ